MIFDNKHVVITGGTGSLGKVLVRRLLSGELGTARRVTVFSRDEAKQHQMRLDYLDLSQATDEIIYRNAQDRLRFRVGDVRDLHAVSGVLGDADIVFNAAALKQVPSCEYRPFEAVQTNIVGAENIVRAVREHKLPVEVVVGVSTDKACKPVNVMGMTKAIQERLLICANLDVPRTRWVCVRYGNVLASRGSVIPLFIDQIKRGGPVTITDPAMTRFLLSLNQAVDLIFSAVQEARAGETFVPRIPAAKVSDVATALIGSRDIALKTLGVRPGEKLHEVMVSEEEGHRTFDRGRHYVIEPILPELRDPTAGDAPIGREYSSQDDVLTLPGVEALLARESLRVEDIRNINSEILR